PDREVVVLHDRVLDAQLTHRIDDLVERLLPAELGTVHADDGQALRRVLAVPVPQLRDHVFAVVSAERPELDGDDAAAESFDAQRRAVDPLAGRQLRRRPAGPRLRTGPTGHGGGDDERGGRDRQGGAAAAGGDVLWFLHADPAPPSAALARIAAALADARVVGVAFEHRFAEPAWSLRAINLVNRLRYRLTRNWYGDQGIFVRADVFR